MAKSPRQTGAELTYSGPITPLHIEGCEPVMLHPGKTYSNLPADHPQVRRMIAREMLVPAPATATETQE